MDTKQVNDALEKLFLNENERIIFWSDPDREIVDDMNEHIFSHIDGVKVSYGKCGTLLAEVKAVTGKMAED